MQHRWRQILSFFAVASLGFGTVLAADPPYLVKDLNTSSQNIGSFPQRFLALRSGVNLFIAWNEDGLELWRSNGNPTGTFPLTEGICESTCWGGELLLPWAQAGDRAFFFVGDEENDSRVLWVTDGTRAGTFPVLEERISYEQTPAWVESLDLLFFIAGDDRSGQELWSSDGTRTGTRLVKEIGSGDLPGSIRELTAFRGKVYFHAQDHRGPALWRSDGTAGGTVLVRDPWRNADGNVGPSWMRVVGQRLLFFASGPGFGYELWSSDGTTRGTQPISDLVPGTPGPEVFDARSVGGRLYFIADAGKGRELWVSNGTRAGTRVLTDFPAANPFYGVTFLFEPQLLNNRLYFPANDSVHGTELWRTDGTRTGTRLVRDLCPGECHGVTYAPSVTGNALVFEGNDGVRGGELWRSDGTAQGTRLVRDLCPGECISLPGPFWKLGDRLLFPAFSPAGRRELWRTDGTAGGTVRLSSFQEGDLSPYAGIMPGALLLNASDATHGFELWTSNGTRQGTRLVKDIWEVAAGSSYPQKLTPLESSLAFVASTPGPGGETRTGLWTSDGTAAGTVSHPISPCSYVTRLLPLAGDAVVVGCPADGETVLVRAGGGVPAPVRLTPPGLSVQYPHEAVVAGGSVFFTAQGALWISDGLSVGRKVLDLAPDDPGSGPTDLASFQGRALFRARSAEAGHDLWVSDGTAAGTKQLTHGNVQPDLFGEFGGRLWFAATTPETGRELWSTDGTEAGTRIFADLDPNLAPQRMVPAGDRMFLAASTGLWVSDGTPGGTRFVAEPNLFTNFPAYGANAVVSADRIFYTTLSPTEGEVLWQSDGTEEGTGPVLGSPETGGLFSSPGWLSLLDGRLYFRWRGAIWSTDGTPAGAQRIETPKFPEELVRSGDRLFFRADDPEHGSELWAVEP